MSISNPEHHPSQARPSFPLSRYWMSWPWQWNIWRNDGRKYRSCEAIWVWWIRRLWWWWCWVVERFKKTVLTYYILWRLKWRLGKLHWERKECLIRNMVPPIGRMIRWSNCFFARTSELSRDPDSCQNSISGPLRNDQRLYKLFERTTWFSTLTCRRHIDYHQEMGPLTRHWFSCHNSEGPC